MEYEAAEVFKINFINNPIYQLSSLLLYGISIVQFFGRARKAGADPRGVLLAWGWARGGQGLGQGRGGEAGRGGPLKPLGPESCG